MASSLALRAAALVEVLTAVPVAAMAAVRGSVALRLWQFAGNTENLEIKRGIALTRRPVSLRCWETERPGGGSGHRWSRPAWPPGSFDR